MSAKKRIDDMTEAEAKAVLWRCIDAWANMRKGMYEFTEGFGAGKTDLEYWRHRALDDMEAGQ